MSAQAAFSGAFRVQQAVEQRLDPKTTRQFTADGTGVLRVPGLLELTGVRIGQIDLPLDMKQEFPADTTHSKMITFPTPMVMLTADESGPVLLRCVQSNDGVWQKDAVVSVSGVWAEDKPTK